MHQPMHRSDLAKRAAEMEALQPGIKKTIMEFLRDHPEDVFTISDMRKALYPEWGNLTDHERDLKVVAMINVLSALEKAGTVEAIRDCGGSMYYGLP